MYITIGALIIFIFCLLMIVLDYNFSFIRKEEHYLMTWIFLWIFGIIALLGGIFAIKSTINYDIEHDMAIQERAAIIYRLEKQNDSDDSYLVNGGVYEDAINFNKKVKRGKKWGNNPWTNWFSGWVYSDLEEIDIIKYYDRKVTDE